MPSHKISHELVLVTMTCCSCSTVYAMPADLERRRHEDRGTFYCPNGHPQVFRESEIERLRGKLFEQTREATIQAERALKAEKALAAQRRKTAHLEKRAKAGVCPCCGRTFSQMARHMAAKHPGYMPEAASH